MEHKTPAQTATSDNETSTTSSEKRNSVTPREPRKKFGQKKAKKPGENDDRTPVTISFTHEFARKLKGLSGLLNEPVSDYVESRLKGPVEKDLKKVLEGLA